MLELTNLLVARVLSNQIEPYWKEYEYDKLSHFEIDTGSIKMTPVQKDKHLHRHNTDQALLWDWQPTWNLPNSTR